MGRNNSEFQNGNPNKAVSFETGHPTAVNSIYTRLPNNEDGEPQWSRNKRSTGEKDTWERTIFISPKYMNAHWHHGLPHGYVDEGDGSWLRNEKDRVEIPRNHMSLEPKVGWTPLQANSTVNPDTGKKTIRNYHRGHPVAKINY